MVEFTPALEFTFSSQPNDICFKYISIAVAIGIPNCANTLSAFSFTSGFTLIFNVAVFP